MRKLITLLVVALAVVCAVAQPPSANPDAAIREIATLLQGQGDREMGKGIVHWTTRVGEVSGCTLQLQVHMTMKMRDAWDKEETIRFPIGALDQSSLKADARSLAVACRDHEKCVYYSVKCERLGNNGTQVDCSESHHQSLAYIYLSADEDNGAALLKNFERAISQCRSPQLAGF